MCKTKVSFDPGTRALCLELWKDHLSESLLSSPSTRSAVALASSDSVNATEDWTVLLRLALLADFYRYQQEDLNLNEEESAEKLRMVRNAALNVLKLIKARDERSDDKAAAPDEFENIDESAMETYLDPRSNAKARGRSTLRKVASKQRGIKRCARTRVRGSSLTLDIEDSVRWHTLAFSTRRKTYFTKLVRAFQVVKNVGHPMITLHSEWSLSCYYKLAVAYTTDSPLEMAAACIPELQPAVALINAEQFHELKKMSPTVQMLLYGILNCHINWVYHNHKQILLVPGQPSALRPKAEGDLRCSRCLKNQTFHSSEVKGNPRNIDVEFDFERMKFGSSCCSAHMVNVPLSTTTVNTCTFTELKQMYTACMKCNNPIFSEILVDMDTLYSRCVACGGKGSS